MIASSMLGTAGGWHVSDAALDDLLEESPKDKKELEKVLLDMDLKYYGMPTLTDCVDKGTGKVKGPIILQLTRIRDVGRPSLGEHSGSSGLLRIFLTDGHSALSALALEKIPDISEDNTPWGTKVLLSGNLPLEGQFVLLSASNCKVLGGRVDRLIEKWVVEKNSVKGVARKVQDDAPKWISFGKKKDDANGKALPKDFRANDVINQGKDEKDDTAADEFERMRKEKLEEVGGQGERKFAKVKVDAPTGGKTDEEKLELMKKKMKERGEKAEERRENRTEGKGRRGRRGSDSDGEVPLEFARPAVGTTLFDFIGGGIVPAPSATPPPPREERRTYDMPERGGGGGGGRGGRGGARGGGRDQRGPQRDYGGERPHSERGPPRGGGGGRGQGRPATDRIPRRDDDRPPRREENKPSRREMERPPRVENDRPPRREEERPPRRDNDRPPRRDDNRPPKEYGRNAGERGPPKDGGRMERGPRDNGRGPNDRGPRDGGVKREERGGQGGQSQDARKQLPSLMGDGLPAKMGGMRLDGGGKGGRAEAAATALKEGDQVRAPWMSDGNFYPATVVHVGPRDMCTVKYNEYGNVTTLPAGVLLR